LSISFFVIYVSYDYLFFTVQGFFCNVQIIMIPLQDFIIPYVLHYLAE